MVDDVLVRHLELVYVSSCSAPTYYFRLEGSGVYVLTHLLSYREAVVAEQVAVDEEELKELQRPWHAAHVDVGLVKEPLEG